MKKSKYLVDRCYTFERALEFFRGEYGTRDISGIEKRLIFLLQIKYWDFEIDSLIFSFETFKERQVDWKENLEDSISDIPYLINPKVIKEIKSKNYWKKYSLYSNNRKDMSAPLEELNTLIENWNTLIDLCENTLLDKKSKDKIENFGILNTEDNLQKYKKEKLSEND